MNRSYCLGKLYGAVITLVTNPGSLPERVQKASGELIVFSSHPEFRSCSEPIRNVLALVDKGDWSRVTNEDYAQVAHTAYELSMQLKTVSALEIHPWYVALLHRRLRGDNARHIELVGNWLKQNADSLRNGVHDEWIPIGIAPTSEEASQLLDQMQAALPHDAAEPLHDFEDRLVKQLMARGWIESSRIKDTNAHGMRGRAYDIRWTEHGARNMDALFAILEEAQLIDTYQTGDLHALFSLCRLCHYRTQPPGR